MRRVSSELDYFFLKTDSVLKHEGLSLVGKKYPKVLYKYEPFNELKIQSLVRDEIYFSPPKDFNDPFDCKPCLSVNSTNLELAQIALALFMLRKKIVFANEAKGIIGPEDLVVEDIPGLIATCKADYKTLTLMLMILSFLFQ